MKVGAFCVSSPVRITAIILATVACATYFVTLRSSLAAEATSSASATSSDTKEKPPAPMPEKKASPDANPIPAGPTKETPGGESKKDVVPAKENKTSADAGKDGEKDKDKDHDKDKKKDDAKSAASDSKSN